MWIKLKEELINLNRIVFIKKYFSTGIKLKYDQDDIAFHFENEKIRDKSFERIVDHLKFLKCFSEISEESMDEAIKITKKSIDKKMDKLVKMDKKQDKKMEKMKKGKC